MKIIMMFVLFFVLIGCSDQPVKQCNPDIDKNCPQFHPLHEVGHHPV